jgi:hypothetical protein
VRITARVTGLTGRIATAATAAMKERAHERMRQRQRQATAPEPTPQALGGVHPENEPER